jgi:CheY-like chemotaxis protein
MTLQSTKRVLIIDDDELFGERSMQVLEKAGFITHFHCGARGVLDALRRTAYDAVLLDVNMPQIDGPRLLRMIRDTHTIRRVRLIFCSNMHQSALQVLAQRFGADHALQKPEDPEQLASALQAIWHAPPLNGDRMGARASSVPPASGTRLKKTVAMTFVPPAAAADMSMDHQISIELPDLVVVKAYGDLSDAAIRHVQMWAEQRPYFLILLDMSETTVFNFNAREQLSEWVRHMPPYAMVAFGSDFHAQVVFEMLQRAILRLSGQPLHRYFAPNELAARAWLDDIRPSLSNRRRLRHAL